MKIIIAILILSAFIGGDSPIVHYNDQDGHREPWSEWKESSCVDEPRIIMDSSYSTPPCNVNTNLGVTVWVCNDGSDTMYPWSNYTTHWYCDSGVIGEALQIHSTFLPLIIK